MGIVAITANDSGVIHPALDEGAVFVHFALDLTVDKVEILVKQSYPIVIAHGLAVYVVLMDLTSTRMASRTQFDLAGIAGGRRAATNFSCRRISHP